MFPPLNEDSPIGGKQGIPVCSTSSTASSLSEDAYNTANIAFLVSFRLVVGKLIVTGY